MDTPFRLRLAYAASCGDPYRDRCPTHHAGIARRHTTTTRTVDHDEEGQHWLTTLIHSLSPSQVEGEVMVLSTSTPSDAVEPSCLSPNVNNAVTASSTAHIDKPVGSISLTGTVENVNAATAPDPDQPVAEENEASPPNRAQEDVNTSVQRGVATPPPPSHSVAPLPTPTPAPLFTSSPQEVQMVDDNATERKDTAVHTDIAGDLAAATADPQQTEKRVEGERVGTREKLLADIAVGLERQLRECVLKVLALDDAQHQLICEFQLPAKGSSAVASPSPFLPSAPSPPSGATHSLNNHAGSSQAATRSEAATCPMEQRHARKDQEAISPTALVANHTDNTLSEEVRKEMALHLYSLRRQVQGLRGQIEAYEWTHYRQVNALRAGQPSGSTTPSKAQGITIVKAYEEDPVPYRKGPWRKAELAAASPRPAPCDETTASPPPLLSTRGPADDAKASLSDRNDDAYGAESFTTVTSALPSVEDTSSIASDANSSSVSSTELLYRKRELAALKAREARRATVAGKSDGTVVQNANLHPLSTSSDSDTTSSDDAETVTSSSRSTLTTASSQYSSSAD